MAPVVFTAAVYNKRRKSPSALDTHPAAKAAFRQCRPGWLRDDLSRKK